MSRKNIAKRLKNWPPSSVLAPSPGFRWASQVVFDFHNTLVDFAGPFSDYVEDSLRRRVDFSSSSFYDWAHDPTIDISADEFSNAIYYFSQMARNGGYGELPAYPGAKEALTELVENGIRPLIWTWTPGVGDQWQRAGIGSPTGIAQERTIALIERLGFPIDTSRDLLFIPPGKKVEEMLERHIPLIIEDSPVTAVHAAATGLASIVVPHSYNSGLRARNLMRLDSLSQLAPTVVQFYKQLEDSGLILKPGR